jgi:ribosomal-protein-alanine N-acetyltransferase
MTIATARLILRRPSLKDVPSVFEILGDAEAMQHTHCLPNLRACRRHVAVHEWRRRRDGCAPWVILDRTDNRLIGYGGLFDDPFDPGWGVEMGYWFRPAAWGKGYATELAMSCLDVADHELCLPEVRAFARPENIGSRRVLEKTGFEVLRFVPEMGRLLYRRARSRG